MERNINAEPIASGEFAPTLIIRAPLVLGFRKMCRQPASNTMAISHVMGLERHARIAKLIGCAPSFHTAVRKHQSRGATRRLGNELRRELKEGRGRPLERAGKWRSSGPTAQGEIRLR